MSFQRLMPGTAPVFAITIVGCLVMSGCATFEERPGPYEYMEPYGAVPPAPPAGMVSGTVVFKNLLFANNKSDLNSDAREVLDEAAAMLRAHPNDSLVITGYASDPGSDSYNMQLGQRRAETAKAYLVSQGIAPERLEVRSAGESQPGVPNTSSSLRALNRRVVLSYIRG